MTDDDVTHCFLRYQIASVNMRRLTPLASSLFTLLGLVLLAASPLAAQSSQDAIAEALPKTVKIFGAGGIAKLHSYGTGFLVTDKGHIVTVWSHVLDSDAVAVVLNDGRRFLGRVVAAEPDFDLAVLKIDAEDLPFFDLAAAKDAGPGTRVIGLSNMFKVATGDEPVSALHGVISAITELNARKGRFEVPYRGPVMVVDAITNNPGGAGGVLLSRDGTLLGMIGRELRNAESNTWINYAIPMTVLREPIEAILEGRLVVREKPIAENASSGYSAVDFGIVLVPDVVFRTPAYVDNVMPNSLAAQLDLRPDDLVVFINDQLVHSIRTLNDELGRLQAEDDLTLVVRRGKELITVQMIVPRREEK